MSVVSCLVITSFVSCLVILSASCLVIISVVSCLVIMSVVLSCDVEADNVVCCVGVEVCDISAFFNTDISVSTWFVDCYVNFDKDFDEWE